MNISTEERKSFAADIRQAPAEMLITGEKQDVSEITAPKGITLRLDVHNAEISGKTAVCAIKKDSGDNPDVTNGMLIYAEVSRIQSGIEITGGQGNKGGT